MEAKHVKGPWRVYSDGVDSIKNTEDFTVKHEDGELTSIVARCYDMAVCEEHGTAKGNAHLISSAPDLLEALKTILLRLDLEAEENTGTQFPCAAMREDIRELIAKAEGKATK